MKKSGQPQIQPPTSPPTYQPVTWHWPRCRGFSLVELMVALVLLSLLSVAAIRVMSESETTLFSDQAQLLKKRQSDAISGYIYEAFESGAISDIPAIRTYANPNMPTDLQKASPLTVASLFGNSSRFAFVEPKCTLVEDVAPGAKTFKFRGDCHQRGGITMAAAINALLALGIKISLSIEGVSARCTISEPIVTTGPGSVAEITVEDGVCLRTSNGPAEAGAHILFTRFVVYDSTKASDYYISMIEPVSPPSPGISLEMPDNQTVIGGAIINPYPHVLTRASLAASIVQIGLMTENADAQLNIAGPTTGVTISGGGTRNLTVSGAIEDVSINVVKHRTLCTPES